MAPYRRAHHRVARSVAVAVAVAVNVHDHDHFKTESV
jgi:hypothetical protein